MITGPYGGKLPLELGASAIMALEHFSKQLDISRLKLTIHLRIHNKLYMDKELTEGLCEPINNRTFLIDVCLFGNWLSNLAHEMVHVKQFARGELNLGMDKWKSRKDCGDIEYWSQPWEKEARRLQHKMLISFHEGEEPFKIQSQ